MKKRNLLFISVLILSIIACTSSPAVDTSSKIVKEVNSASIDFNQLWLGTVRIKEKSDSSLGDQAEVVFYSEWTLGESAGIVYPKKITEAGTDKQVDMDFHWDNGGDITAGSYDVYVDIDGTIRTGIIKNLELSKGMSYEVYISFNAARIDISLETDGDNVVAYPAGTYTKYENLGRLDNIPDEIIINTVSSYTENNSIYWLIPAGKPLDILRTFSNGDEKWSLDYVPTPESFIKDLP